MNSRISRWRSVRSSFTAGMRSCVLRSGEHRLDGTVPGGRPRWQTPVRSSLDGEHVFVVGIPVRRTGGRLPEEAARWQPSSSPGRPGTRLSRVRTSRPWRRPPPCSSSPARPAGPARPPAGYRRRRLLGPWSPCSSWPPAGWSRPLPVATGNAGRPVPATAVPIVHVAQPGETLLVDRRDGHAGGDLRSAVDRWWTANGGVDLQPGDRIASPAEARRGAVRERGGTVRPCAVRCARARRQGRRLAPGRRRRRHPPPARVPRLRPALHDVRARRGGAARRREAVGDRAPFDRAKVVAGVAPRPRTARCRTSRWTSSRPTSRRRCACSAPRSPARTSASPVLVRLESLDHVAYLRFASVYKGFEDITDFQREVGSWPSRPSPSA